VIIGVIAAYVAIWTLYGVLAKSGQNIHFDSAQWVAFSYEPALGYYSHPPFSAWVAGAWFSVFPNSDWAYSLLCMMLAGLTMLSAWLLFARFLDHQKRVLGLALLTFIPFYNFHILKYDHDRVLMPIAAATILWTIRSLETRSIGWAVLTGAGAGAAMLTKYWAIFLLMALAVAVLLDPRRRAYFRSAAPWITIAVGTAILVPHLFWLFANDFPPIQYAGSAHKADSFARAVVRAGFYLSGGFGYIAIPCLVAVAASQPNRAAIADVLLPATSDRRWAATVFWLPLLLPVLVALMTLQKLEPIWVMSGLVLLPVVLLSSPLIAISRMAAQSIVAIAMLLPLVLLAAAPAIAIAIHRTADLEAKNLHARQLAERLGQDWRLATDKPLQLVGGDLDFAWLLAFYRPERPSAYAALNRRISPWIDDGRLAREGIAMVCQLAESAQGPGRCKNRQIQAAMEAIAARAPNARRVETEITSRYFGGPSRTSRFFIVIASPRP
jgi:4-amino-4-deoxy-L-arabinose transferase-like glycosyltransferase